MTCKNILNLPNYEPLVAGDQAKIMEVDHDAKQVFMEEMKMITDSELHVLQPSQETITARLTAPIVTTYVDVDKISFERYIKIFL